MKGRQHARAQNVTEMLHQDSWLSQILLMDEC
jgi:hypothetical protein